MKRIFSWSHLLVWLLLLGACVPETVEPITPPATVTPGALRAVGEPTAVSTSTPQTQPNEEATTSPPETSNTAVPSATPTNTATATPVIIEGGSLPTPVATIPPENYPVPPETDTAVGNETNSSGYPAPGEAASATEQPFTATGGNSSENTAVAPPPTATVDPDAIFADEGPTETTAEEVLRLIFEDLRTLGIDISEADVEIEEIVAGSWPDSSLGCPEPGMNYLQVITPGYMVTLLVEGETYIYHTDDALNILLCEQADRIDITPARPEDR